MDLRQLQYFVQIAKSGGFNRASEVLHVAQSALSRRMRELEDELGVDLFARSARGVQLTPAGEFMAERAEDLLRQFREIRSQLLARASVPHGSIAFGIPPIMREILAIPVVKTFNALHPNVEITYVAGLSSEIRELILSGRIDLGVFGVLEPETVLRVEPLMQEDLIAVGRSQTVFVGRVQISAEEMSTLPLVLSNKEQFRVLLKRTGSSVVPNWRQIHEINDSTLLMDMVLSENYYSILPRCMVEDYLRDGRLHGAVVTGAQYEWVVGHAPDQPLSAAARAIQEILIETAKGRTARGRDNPKTIKPDKTTRKGENTRPLRP